MDEIAPPKFFSLPPERIPLRDFFAATALTAIALEHQSICSIASQTSTQLAMARAPLGVQAETREKFKAELEKYDSPEAKARQAYAIADALLAERLKNPSLPPAQ
jgi:hypothetical protein